MNGKLVRDKIPEIIAKDTSKSVLIKVLSQEEYKDALHRKLDEEVAEFHQSGDVEELVDILHVVLALAADKGYTTEHFVGKANKKERERGVFNKRYFLCDTEEEGRPTEELKSDKAPKEDLDTSISPKAEQCHTCLYSFRGGGCKLLSGEVEAHKACNGCPMYIGSPSNCKCVTVNIGEPCPYYKAANKEAKNEQT